MTCVSENMLYLMRQEEVGTCSQSSLIFLLIK